jgi:hypothetical protein
MSHIRVEKNFNAKGAEQRKAAKKRLNSLCKSLWFSAVFSVDVLVGTELHYY